MEKKIDKNMETGMLFRFRLRDVTPLMDTEMEKKVENELGSSQI